MYLLDKKKKVRELVEHGEHVARTYLPTGTTGVVRQCTFVTSEEGLKGGAGMLSKSCRFLQLNQPPALRLREGPL